MANLQVPWFESPFFDAELAAADLDPVRRDRVRRFADDGYLQFPLDMPEFERIADEILSGMAPEHERLGNRIQDAWQHSAAVRSLATAPEIMTTLRDLYGREPIPFQTLNFRQGSEQRAHSDVVHFNSMPHRFLAGVWVALEDVSESLGNGPLFYYPGSHRLPIIELHDLGVAGGYRGRDARYAVYEDFVEELMATAELPRVVIEAKRGDVLIWSANMVHGGLPITTPGSTRQTQVTHVFFEGCRYYNPLYSQPALADFRWRRIVDLRDGRVVPHRVDGKQVRLPLGTQARYLLESGIRSSALGRAIVDAGKRRIRGG